MRPTPWGALVPSGDLQFREPAMVRITAFALLLALIAGGVFAPYSAAEEAEKESAPEMATDEEVAEALKEFKEAWKAKGLKGDDKVAF